MPSSIKKTESFKEMSNEELAELAGGFVDLRNHADRNLEVILEEMRMRLENNLIK